MDSLINAAARSLALGDPVQALKLIALRSDAAGLALRGIAMAQLGELARARELLRSAARAFSPREAMARARCIVAEAEIALVSRDLTWTGRALETARGTLDKHGDRVNALHARTLEIRRLLLIGRLDEAERALHRLPSAVPEVFRISHELIAAGIALRRIEPGRARDALLRAREAARRVAVPALAAEVESAFKSLDAPAARIFSRGTDRPATLDDVAALLATDALIVDDCRHLVRQGRMRIALGRRPVLLSLVRALARAWPGDVTRDELVAHAFRLSLADESNRARLRVEIGRLRRLLGAHATIEATDRGFVLKPARAREVAVIARLVEGKHGDVLALLGDGEAWSTSALAQALDVGQRTVQRALDELALEGKVQPVGRGRSRRWLTPPAAGFTTVLLLPAALPVD